jgi:hypothetical protein
VVVVVSTTSEVVVVEVVVVDVVVVDCSGMVGSGANDVLVGTEEVVVDSTVVVTATVVVDTSVVVVDTSVVVVVAVNSHNDRLLIVRCPGEQQVSVEY